MSQSKKRLVCPKCGSDKFYVIHHAATMPDGVKDLDDTFKCIACGEKSREYKKSQLKERAVSHAVSE